MTVTNSEPRAREEGQRTPTPEAAVLVAGDVRDRTILAMASERYATLVFNS